MVSVEKNEREMMVAIKAFNLPNGIFTTMHVQATETFRRIERTGAGSFNTIEKKGIESATNISKAWGWWSKNAAGVATGIGAFVKAAEMAWDAIGYSARYEENVLMIEKTSSKFGMSGKALVEAISSSSQSLISLSDASAVANEALAKNMTPEQLINLAGAAKTLSDVTGNSASVEFRNLADAVASGNAEYLKQFDNILKLKGKYGEITSSAEMYKVVISAVKEHQDALGDMTLSASDKMELMKSRFENIKLTLGDWAATIFDWFYMLGEGIGIFFAKMAEDPLKAIWEVIYEWIAIIDHFLLGDIIEKGRVFVVNLIQGVKEKVPALYNQGVELVVEFLSKVKTKAAECYDAGVTLVKEFIAGIKSKAEESYNAVKDWLSGFVPFMEGNSPPPKGPLRGLNDWGANIPRTLADGIRSNSGAVEEAVVAIASLAQNVLGNSNNKEGGLFGSLFGSGGLTPAVAGAGANADFYAAYLSDRTAFMEESYLLEESYANREIELERNKWALKHSAAQGGSWLLLNVLDKLNSATGGKSRAMFNAMKGVALSEALVSTYAGAAKALNMPFPANLAAMATVISAGMAQVMKIRSTNAGGSGASSGGSYGGGGYSSAHSSLSLPDRITEEKALPTQNITVNVHNPLSEGNWSAIGEDIVKSINAAGDRNIKLNINAVAAA